jgi:hypothetical protein
MRKAGRWSCVSDTEITIEQTVIMMLALASAIALNCTGLCWMVRRA